MATIRFNHLLRKHVAEATVITDLIPLLSELITLEEIRHILDDRIQKLDSDAERRICCNALPIQAMLPIDLIQHIVSFTDSSLVQYINKAFKQCFDQNKNIMLRERQSVIDKEAFSPNINYDETKNKTWIVHPTRTALNDHEIALGYEGPVHRLSDACARATSGDKVLVHDGKYIDHEGNMNLDKKLQIIGLGDEVCIKNNCIAINKKMFFQNIKFDRTVFCTRLSFSPSTVWMENCEFRCGQSKIIGIIVTQQGTLNAKHCIFHGPTRLHLNGPPRASAKFIGCMFINFRRTCIEINLKDEEENEKPYSLKCIGNIFKNNRAHPISAIMRMHNINTQAKMVTHVLKHNILQGYNRIDGREVISANTMHLSVDA
eukprot:515273_1